MKEIPTHKLHQMFASKNGNKDGLISHQNLMIRIFHHLFIEQYWKIVEVFKVDEELTN